MHGVVAVAMEPDKYRAHAVPVSRTAGGGSSVGDDGPGASMSSAHEPSKSLPNGTLSHSEAGCSSDAASRSHGHAPLRTALSCEENECEPAEVDSTDAGERNNMERACPKYRFCRERMCGETYDLDAPSSSGTSSRRVAGEEDEGRSGEVRRSRKRAADCRAERSNLDAEASSSDTSNDDYSLGSEDGCIYTYRGGEHLADLPSSFFSLDMGLPRDHQLPAPPAYAPRPADAPVEERRGSRASSPDMDYLEMDFDPGPSCDADSGEETIPDEDLEASPSPEPPERPAARGTTPDAGPSHREPVVERLPIIPSLQQIPQEQESGSARAVLDVCLPSTSWAGLPPRTCVAATDVATATTSIRAGAVVTHVNVRGERVLVRRTCRRWPPRTPATHHIHSGDLVCERGGGEGVSGVSSAEAAPTVDRVNLSSALYHCTMAKKLIVEKPNTHFMEGADTSNLTESEAEADVETEEASVCEVSRCMIWSEREACERQVTQIATSACGATAVINAFLALGVPIDTDKINKAVGTRQRANNAPIPRYLLSRAVAGCTALGMVAGLQQASDGLVTARFFPTYPERVVSLSHWLADWISLGAVPIATLNLQAGCEPEQTDTDIPDAWHHQMVFGVSPRGVFLANPVECVQESQLWPQLCSDSVLLVRSRDVLTRLTPATDLTPLTCVPDPRWPAFNVLGQVVNVIREAREVDWGGCGAETCSGRGTLRSRHIRIPCAYRAGITLAALTGSEAHRRLTRAHHLPLYASDSNSFHTFQM